MAIRNRIAQFIITYVRNIQVSAGNVLLGRESGAGIAQEIEVGDGLTLDAGVISADVTTADLAGKADALGVDDNYVTDSEKTKLSNLSGTNTGDEDAESITAALQGAEADPTKIGAEYLPDALARTSGSPNDDVLVLTANFGDGSETVTLIGVVGVDGFWSSDGEINPAWSGEWYYAQDSFGGVATVAKFAGGVAGGYFTGTGDLPIADVVTWTPTSPATGTVTVEEAPVTGSFRGQLLRVTDTGVWWRWDGSDWVEVSETTESILTKLQGATPVEGKIGREYLPVGTVLTAAEYSSLTLEAQMDPTKWYIISG